MTNLELGKFSPTEFKMKLALFVFVFALVSVALASPQDKPQQQEADRGFRFHAERTNKCLGRFGGMR